MRKNFMEERLPEIVFSSSDSFLSQQITKLVEAGKLRKLFPKVYTSNMIEEAEVIVQKNIWRLISHLFPQSILSHRSAIEFGISPKGNIYLTGINRRVYKWPGVTIRFAKGAQRLKDDNILFEHLFASSLERAMLENLGRSREVEGEKRTLDQAVLEERLLVEFNAKGEQGLNQLRDRAKTIAMKLGWEKQFSQLNKIISSILSSKPSSILKSPVALATALGEPYDAGRMDLFQRLIGALKQTAFKNRVTKADSKESFNLIAFFESYFSNYIEGTTFEVEEARDIIFKGKDIPNRTGDTHDIRGTYQVVQDRFEMNKVPSSAEEFIKLLRERHQIILRGRKEKNPGNFKTIANRAGDSFFVKPEMVSGTLKSGFKLMGSLTSAIERAFFMMFLVSEVHPFDDGNGRIARVMMNSELVHGNASKLIIPTVYRDDYVLNLKKFTRQGEPKGYIKMMERAHAFSHWLEPQSFEFLLNQLNKSNAFKESEEAALQFPK